MGLIRVITEHHDDSDPTRKCYTMDKVKEIPGSRLLFYSKLHDAHCPFDPQLLLACLRSVEKEEQTFFGWEMHREYLEADVAGNLELIAARIKAGLLGGERRTWSPSKGMTSAPRGGPCTPTGIVLATCSRWWRERPSATTWFVRRGRST